MIVACPSCQTRFRLDERRLGRGRSLLRCSRCQHTFPSPGVKPRPPRRAAPEEAESLSFGFDDDEEWTPGPLVDPAAEEDGEFQLREDAGEEPVRRSSARRTKTRDAGLPVVVPGTDVLDPEEDFQVDEEEFDEEEPRRRTISLKPVFIFLALVVVGYALFARALYANPRWAGEMIGELPLVGSDLGERELERRVALIDVQSRHDRTKDGKLVFVITGKAVNQSASRIKNVQVAATLLDASGKAIGRQVTFCGNTVRTELIRHLSSQQVAILAGLRPPHYFSVQPGATCPFVSIFSDVPAGLQTFTAQVATVQRHG